MHVPTMAHMLPLKKENFGSSLTSEIHINREHKKIAS